MILGRDILYELNIDLCLSDNTIWVNVGTYKGCTASTKDVSNINFNSSSDFIKDRIFYNAELWERKCMNNAT